MSRDRGCGRCRREEKPGERKSRDNDGEKKNIVINPLVPCLYLCVCVYKAPRVNSLYLLVVA